MSALEQRHEAQQELLDNLAEAEDELRELQAELEDHWTLEDGPYRFLHQSWKVYRLQGAIEDAIETLWELRPESQPEHALGLNPDVVRIVNEGTTGRFRRPTEWPEGAEGRDPETGVWHFLDDAGDLGTNVNWLEETRPIVEAFFWTKWFVDRAVQYAGEHEEPPQVMESGLAGLYYLYNIR